MAVNFFESLRERYTVVTLPVEEEWLLYSLDDKRAEEVLSVLVDADDDGYSISLMRRNGITAAERKKCGESYKKQEDLRRQYDSLVQACARQYQVPEADISMLVNVQLKSELLKLLVEKDQNRAADLEAQDRMLERSRDLVATLGDDFKRLCELKNNADDAFLDYRYELGAYILSSPLRVKNLADNKAAKLKLTKEDMRAFDQNLVNRIYSDFINKEEGGKDAWESVVRKTFTATWDGKGLTPAEGIDLKEGAVYEIEAKEVFVPAEVETVEEPEGGEGKGKG